MASRTDMKMIEEWFGEVLLPAVRRGATQKELEGLLEDGGHEPFFSREEIDRRWEAAKKAYDK